MTQASQIITQQYVDGGVVGADLQPQQAASKKYVDDQLATRDKNISAAAGAAGAAQSSINNHIVSPKAHPAQNITYSGKVVGAPNVKAGLDALKTEIDQAVVSGDSGPEARTARYSTPRNHLYDTLKDRLDTSDVLLMDLAYNVRAYGAVGDGVTDDTPAIRDAISAMGYNAVLLFPAGTYRITDTIDLPIGGKTVYAYGATFLLDNYDGVVFDLNPNADPSRVEATSQSYGFWYGGIFRSTLTNPDYAAALRFYGIRQMVVRDVRIGVHGTVMFKSGLEFAGLGGHLIEKVRFLYVDQCFYVPNWSNDSVSAPVTTSTFNNNEFILGPNQFAFRVLGGWNRWRIFGGFANAPAGCTVMYFTNNPIGGACTNLLIQGVGFEQLGVGSKFIHLDDIHNSSMSLITLENCSFQGDPAAGGATAVTFERCQNIKISACRFEQTTAAGNTNINFDANCQSIFIDRACYFAGAGMVSSVARRRITMEPQIERISYLVLTGYNGNTFSSGGITLDMKSLLGTDYPLQIPPLGYFVQVQARDSGSAASTTAGVEIMQEAATTATKRLTLDLAGVPNDRRVSAEGYVLADSNGNIALQIYASGQNTLSLWIYIVGIHN